MCHHPHQQTLKEDLSTPRRDGWRQSPFSGKDTFCPRDPPEAHHPMRCFTPVESWVAYISRCPPANVLGLPVPPSSPNPAHHPRAGQSTLERGEKEQEEDLHPKQLSTLPWPSRRQLSLKGDKEKRQQECLNIPHAMRAGMESKGCAGGTPASDTASSLLPLPLGGPGATGHPS